MNDRGRTKLLPLIPGFNPDKNTRRSFHKPQLFGKIHDGIYYLADKKLSDTKNPPIYATDECAKLVPTWLVFDRQTLVFKSYFEEESMGNHGSVDRRLVNIYFFLEDGTIKISEPPTTNSGLEQGVLVRRQKIPIPNSRQPQYYTVTDLNIGKSPTIFGRVYTIFDCDQFTRQFLTRIGIYVPEPDLEPTEKEDETSKIKWTRKENALSKFLKFDKQILRFFGYWDESENPNGIIRDVEIYYFLADDTIEIKEVVPKKLLKDYGTMHVKKTRIPKCFKHIDPIGMDQPNTILNIMIKDHPKAKNYYVLDPIRRMETDSNYYSEIDLFIGARLNVFGREIVITDLDGFTKHYYKNKYGLENFTPLGKPGEDDKTKNYSEWYIPPYNGFGSYEDSLNNCFRIVPRPLKKDFIKFYRFGDLVLRFRAKMVSDVAENANREFIIRYFFQDDTISIYELADGNSGFQSSLFQNRMQVLLPNEEVLTNKKPRIYDKDYFYVGSVLNLNGFKFVLVSADLYCIRYMESNPSEFPRSNAKLIMQKIREALKPVYKQFIQEYLPSGDDLRWDVNSFKHAMDKYLGDKLSQHEIITIGRRYSSPKKKEVCTREYVRSLVHNELRRFSWDTLDRLEQNIQHVDKHRRGFLTRKQLYTILRGSQIPLNVELLNSMLDHINKNHEEKLDCNDLLRFMNVNIDPLAPVLPVDMKTALWWASEKEPDCGTGIDWRAFLKDLGLNEEESIKECSSRTE